jgi:hypothetical protein
MCLAMIPTKGRRMVEGEVDKFDMLRIRLFGGRKSVFLTAKCLKTKAGDLATATLQTMLETMPEIHLYLPCRAFGTFFLGTHQSAHT